MCGINGVISHDIRHRSKILVMNQLIAHRGPDDEGFVTINSHDNSFRQFSGDDSIEEIKNRYPILNFNSESKDDVVFASRRLSIIDLTSKGHMPMHDDNEKYWITYNGEIYNYIELREILISKGYKFHSGNDTEVILNSYIEWGVECLNKFNGMWSFAIWDPVKKYLFAARDRFGVKPFYYIHLNDAFAFSSELKPLIYFNKENFSINESKIPYFLLFGNKFYEDDTYINNLCSLEASHYIILKNNQLTKKRYYDVNSNIIKNKSKEELKDELINILQDSIRLRFRSDVEVGACLSGGFDSSSIVTLAGKIKGSGIKTFSAVWPDNEECNENRYIDIVNKATLSESNKVSPDPYEFEEVFNKICYYQEIPTEGPGLIPQWYVMKKAKGKVKVLLDGQGGDEVFGGYFISQNYIRSLLKDKRFKELFSDINLFIKLLSKEELHRISNWVFPRFYNRFYRGYISGRKRIINRDVLKRTDKKELYYESKTSGKFKPYLNDLSHHFITKLTIPTLLHYEDRSSMAHSIESRVPFLDYRLVEFGLNLPSEYLVNKERSRPLFRETMSGILPQDIVKRTDKLGFPVPFAQWTRNSLKKYITDILSDKIILGDYLNMNQLNTLLNDHFAEVKDNSWEIWRVLSLHNFLKSKAFV